jgi:hypothetical protein
MGAIMNLNKSDLKEACKGLFDDFEGVLTLKWDKGFEAFSAEFSVEDQEKVSSVLDRHLNLKWDKNTIRTAPDIIKKKTGDFGDLRPGQMLFTSDPEGDVLIFAAWWPWGNNETISMRIASPGTESSDSEKPGILTRVIGFFSG